MTAHPRILFENGFVTNCIISKNFAGGNGGGIYTTSSNAYIKNCVISENNTGTNVAANGSGSGAYITGGEMQNCIIVSNSGPIQTGWGGGVRLAGVGTSLKNCLIQGNRSYYYAGVYITWNSTIDNCAIVQNVSTGSAASGGIRFGNTASDAIIRNSIVKFNYGTAGEDNWSIGSGHTATFYNCCTAPLPLPGPSGGGAIGAATTNNIDSDPLFVSTNAANYRLTRQSPCVNTGINQGWMTDAFDLDGRRRIDRFSGTVDMGAYEFLHSGVVVSFH